MSEPFGEGARSGGLGVLPSLTREETEPFPHDSPLSAGYTTGSDEGSGKLKELMDTCTKLSKQVALLEKELAQTKEQHAKDIQGLHAEITTLKEDMQQLKRHKSTNIVFSSPSSSHGFD